MEGAGQHTDLLAAAVHQADDIFHPAKEPSEKKKEQVKDVITQ